MLQVPSLLTIHAPIGWSGLQVFLNNLQSSGLANPLKIGPQIHPLGASLTSFTSISYLTLALYWLNSSLISKMELGIFGNPLHSLLPTSNTWSITFELLHFLHL